MKNNERGLTLVEVLLATLLLSFGLLAVAPMFIHAMQVSSTGADLGIAGAAATARLEQLREAEYDSDALQPGGSLTSNVTVTGTAYFDTSSPGVLVRWQISDGTLARTRIVAVRATALDPATGAPKTASLVSLRGE